MEGMANVDKRECHDAWLKDKEDQKFLERCVVSFSLVCTPLSMFRCV